VRENQVGVFGGVLGWIALMCLGLNGVRRNLRNSALKAAMSRPTARKYVAAVQPPQELQAKRRWRTRKDPLVEI